MKNKKFFVVSMLFILMTASFIGCDENSNSDGPTESSTPSFLFVQNAESGTLEPIEGEVEKLLLTLNNLLPDTVYFSDRPERITGQQPTPEILNNFFSDLSTPPNAALQIRNDDGSVDVIALSLLTAEFNSESQSISYEVTIIPEELEFHFDPNNNQPISADPVFDTDGLVPMGFDLSSLFIDSTSAAPPTCTLLTGDDTNICFSPASMADCNGDGIGESQCGEEGESPKCCFLYMNQFFCCVDPPF